MFFLIFFVIVFFLTIIFAIFKDDKSDEKMKNE